MSKQIIMIQVDVSDPVECEKVTKAIQMLVMKVGNKKLIKLAEAVVKNPSLLNTALSYIS